MVLESDQIGAAQAAGDVVVDEVVFLVLYTLEERLIAEEAILKPGAFGLGQIAEQVLSVCFSFVQSFLHMFLSLSEI